jgi:hypothetical protein
MLIFFISFITEIVDSKDLENRSDLSSTYKVKAGTAVFLIELEKRRSIKASGYASSKFSPNISLNYIPRTRLLSINA